MSYRRPGRAVDARGRGRHRRRAGHGYLRLVRATASANLASTLLSAMIGLVLARLLGTTGRGSYAAISAYMGLASTVGAVGISAAVCFFVAHRRPEAADVTRTSFRILAVLGSVSGVIGIALARPLFGDRPQVAALFTYVSAAQPVIFVSAAYVFTLQATSLRAWNAVRVFQPLVYALALGGLAAAHAVTLGTAIAGLLASCVAQTLLARAIARRSLDGAGRFRRDLVGPLMRYGLANLAATTPYVVNSKLDQLLLAVVVQPAELGQYAVAVSLSLLSGPIAMAFGNVAMPRIAASHAQPGSVEPGLVRSALLGSFAVGAVTAVGLCLLAPVLLTRLLGAGYAGSVGPLCVLAPGGVLLSCNRVMGDILRGFNRSLTVARCEGVGAVCTVATLALLVPWLGIMGAAIASTAAYSVSFALLGRAVAKVVRSGRRVTAVPAARTEGVRAAPAPPPAGPAIPQVAVDAAPTVPTNRLAPGGSRVATG